MLVQFLVESDEEDENGEPKSEWRNLYINETKIVGFYMPNEFSEEPSVNILIDGSVYTLKQTKSLKQHLEKRFINA